VKLCALVGRSQGRTVEFLLVCALHHLLELQRDSLGDYFIDMTVFVSKLSQ